MIPNGRYRTVAGSKVTLSGTNGGISEVIFDWFEEPDACMECQPEPYPVDCGDGELRLAWRCDHCGGGSARLHPIKELIAA